MNFRPAQFSPADIQGKRSEMGFELAKAMTGRSLKILEDGDALMIVDEETGEALHDTPWGTNLGIRYACLLIGAASPENHVVGTFDGGEQVFSGGTALWKSSLRIDPNWMEAMRRRSRSRAKRRIREINEELPATERWAMTRGNISWRLGWKLLTLTMQPFPDASTVDEVRRFNLAFRTLQKLPEWKHYTAKMERVVACIKGIEDKLTPRGPYVHGHFLLLSRYIDKETLRRCWWECLNRATRKMHGVPCELMPGGLPHINVKNCVRKAKRDDQTDWDSALDEVSKYITKTQDLLKPDEQGNRVSPAVLRGLCSVRRWPRMFEMLGMARVQPAKRAGHDTACISVQGKLPADIESWWTEALEAEEKEKYESMGINFWENKTGRHVLTDPKKKARPPSWRDLMEEMSLYAWLQVVWGRIKRGRNFRIKWLAEHNPHLDVMRLDGQQVYTSGSNLDELSLCTQE